VPRLVNSRTGVTVNVSDETAVVLGSAYAPAAEATKAEAEDKPTRRASTK
jgi:hypothetical protein